MRSHAKASTAGSTEHQAGRLAQFTLLILTSLLTLAPSAFAAPSRSFEKSIGASQFATSALNPQALTVDQSNGDIYAINTATSAVHRLDSSGAAKSFTAGTDIGTNTLTGFSFDSTVGSNQVAVDNSPGPANGDIYVTDSNNAAVKVFAGDGTLLTTLTGSGTPAGAFTKPCGVAVDQANGNLYIADFGERVWRYTPSADPVTEVDYSGGIVTAVDPGGTPTAFKPCQAAADSGNVYIVENRLPDFFEFIGPARKFAATDFALGPPPSPASVLIDEAATAVATDPTTGEAYVNKGSQIVVYDSACAAALCSPIYTFGSATDFGTTSAGVAVMGSNGPAYVSDRRAVATPGRHIDVFAPAVEPVKLSVKKAASGSGTVTSAPAGIDCGATCEADFNKGSDVTLTASADTGSKFKAWSGCDSVSVDDKCVVNMNAAREVTVTFAGRPTISEQATKAHDTSARLEAKLDPESEETTYRFQYVDQAGFEADGYLGASSAPVPAVKLPAGLVPVPVFTVIEGLTPGTTYHFRLVAFNSIGESVGPDQTFTTHLLPAPGLPGNRAYEQASPVAKNGLDASGTPRTVRATPSGDGITFVTHSGIPGGVGAPGLPLNLARRGADGWSTQGIMPPNSEGENADVIGWTPDFSHVFSQAKRFVDPVGSGTKTLLDSSTAVGSLTTIVPHTVLGSERNFYFAGASADGSKVFFESDGAALADGAVPGVDNLYAWDRESEEITLVGVLPDDACDSPPCPAPEGSFAGPYDWVNGEKALDLGGAKREYYAQDQHAISPDGERAFFTAGGTGEIYLRTDPIGPGATTVEISTSEKENGPGDGTDAAGTRPKAFMGASPDGSSAFFTSAEKLTDEADTGPEPDGFPAIARAEIDGDPSDLGFLPATAAGSAAVAIDGTHIYWVDAGEGNPGEGTIGRATLNGATDVEPDFIEGASNPNGIAVGEGFIYWTNAGDEEDGTGTIGRADINGTLASVDQDCVTGAHNPQGIAVGGGFIYWGNSSATGEAKRGIGRAGLDCDGATQAFIPGVNPNFPRGIAVDGSHLYWTGVNFGGDGETVLFSRISRANLGGDGFILNFIPLTTSGRPEPDPKGIALNGTHFFWAQPGTDSIGRANLAGNDVNTEFLTGVGSPRGLALDGSHLYWAANQEVLPNLGNDLYRYDEEADEDGHHLADLSLADGTVAPGTNPNGADVKGILGASNDGTRVYFAANGVLTTVPNERGESAVPGNCPEHPGKSSGTCNLYLADDGEISFIARLAFGDQVHSDALNWIGTPSEIFAGSLRVEKTARVTPDGGTLLFRSQRQLTEYDNKGKPMLYRYSVADGELSCVSCDPSGAPPTSALTRSVRTVAITPNEPATTLSRALSNSGDQIFFESTDALIAADTNGDEGCPETGSNLQGYFACQDVYMWEAEGSGSCETDQQGGGCLYLLSSGKSPYPSFLADASASGDDVFFFTRDHLVGQDTDQLYDVYDARVNGGLASQNEAPPVPCEGEGCKPGASTPPESTSAGSASFSGPGNPKAGKKSRPRCAKGKRRVRRNGKARCVKRQQRGNRRNANTTGRAGR